MRILVAAVFAAVGVPLVVLPLGTLAASPPIDRQTFAMMQIIAGLLCILISVVAGLMRPSGRTAADAPREATTQPEAGADPLPARDGTGMGVLIVLLAITLIALALWLRTPSHEKDARALIPVPASGSAPAPARPMARTVTPSGGAEARKTSVRPRAPSRARPAREHD